MTSRSTGKPGVADSSATAGGRGPGLLALLRRHVVALVIAFVAVPAGASTVLTVDIDGPIGVSSALHVETAVAAARERNAAAVLIRIDTPGGLLSSTHAIIRELLSASVPVIVYVAPQGARAASAGTYITYAAHVAAMAPGTHIGAATPVSMQPLPGMPQPGAPKRPFAPDGGARDGGTRDGGNRDGGNRDGGTGDGGSGDATREGGASGADASERSSGSDAQRASRERDPEPATAMERKALNDAVAFIRSLAQLRGRNAEWAERAVIDAATITASEALEKGVVDIVAASDRELLEAAHGRSVQVGDATRTLDTRGAELEAVEPDLRTRVLGALADPNIAFILLLVGIYGLILEFWTPGFGVGGIIGGLSLVLAFVALSMLPVDYGGLALLALGLVMLAAEALSPGIGAMGIGGIVAFVFGALFLFDPAGADIAIGVAKPLIAGAAVTTAAVFLLAFGFVLRSRRQAVATGAEEMLGAAAVVLRWEGDRGTVRAHGEVWQARGPQALQAGDKARVVRREGLTLILEKGDFHG